MFMEISRLFSVMRSNAPFLMGIVMIFVGVFTITSGGNLQPKNFSELCVFISSLAYILGGLIIIYNHDKTLLRTVGIYALLIGFGRFITSIDQFFAKDVVTFIGGFMLMILSINLMISGRSYLANTSRNNQTMFYGTGLLLMVNISTIIMNLRLGIPIEVILETDISQIFLIALYGIYLAVLDTDEIRLNTVHFQNSRSLNAVRQTVSMDYTLYVKSEDYSLLNDAMTSRSGWTQVNDNGPVESEVVLNVFSDKGQKYVMYIQKWKEKENLYFFLFSDVEGSKLYAIKLVCSDIKDDDCGSKWILGENNAHICLVKEGASV